VLVAIKSSGFAIAFVGAPTTSGQDPGLQQRDDSGRDVLSVAAIEMVYDVNGPRASGDRGTNLRLLFSE